LLSAAEHFQERESFGRPVPILRPWMKYFFVHSLCDIRAKSRYKIGTGKLEMPNDAEDLDPEQVRKNSDDSVEKMRSLMSELKIVQEYENAIMTEEEQPSNPSELT
jgi:hypothetical protein